MRAPGRGILAKPGDSYSARAASAQAGGGRSCGMGKGAMFKKALVGVKGLRIDCFHLQGFEHVGAAAPGGVVKLRVGAGAQKSGDVGGQPRGGCARAPCHFEQEGVQRRLSEAVLGVRAAQAEQMGKNLRAPGAAGIMQGSAPVRVKGLERASVESRDPFGAVRFGGMAGGPKASGDSRVAWVAEWGSGQQGGFCAGQIARGAGVAQPAPWRQSPGGSGALGTAR